jgi:hypothetical protein
MLPRKKPRPNPADTAANNDSRTLVSDSTTEAPTSQSQASKASPAAGADQNSNPQAPSRQQTMAESDVAGQRNSKDVRIFAFIPKLLAFRPNNTSRLADQRVGTVLGHELLKPRHQPRLQRKTYLEEVSSQTKHQISVDTKPGKATITPVFEVQLGRLRRCQRFPTPNPMLR